MKNGNYHGNYHGTIILCLKLTKNEAKLGPSELRNFEFQKMSSQFFLLIRTKIVWRLGILQNEKLVIWNSLII